MFTELYVTYLTVTNTLHHGELIPLIRAVLSTQVTSAARAQKRAWFLSAQVLKNLKL